MKADTPGLALLGLALLATPARAQDPSFGYFPEPTVTTARIEAVVTPYLTPPPVPDAEAVAFLDSRRGEPVFCLVKARVAESGDIISAVGVGCPEPLRASAVGAVRLWRFYPPTIADRAVDASHTVQFVFLHSSVVLDSTPVPEGATLVRTLPVAVPDWPSPPRLSRAGRDWLDQQGLDGYRCRLDLEVSADGMMEKVLVVDCPGPLVEPFLKRGRRFGFQVEGATPGDGTVYRVDTWIAR